MEKVKNFKLSIHSGHLQVYLCTVNEFIFPKKDIPQENWSL